MDREVLLPSQRIDLDGAADRRAAGARDAIRPRVFTVGFVGTLGRANVLETLVDAARLLGPDEAQIVVVGQGRSAMPTSRARRAAQHRLRRPDTQGRRSRR